MDAPKTEPSTAPLIATVSKEAPAAAASSPDSKPASQKATAVKEEVQTKPVPAAADSNKPPTTSPSAVVKPPAATVTTEPKQPPVAAPVKQSFSFNKTPVPQPSTTTAPLASFKKTTSTTPASPKTPVPATQASSSKPSGTATTAKPSTAPAPAPKPTAPPKKEEVEPANESKQEQQPVTPPKSVEKEKVASVRPPTPNLSQPQTLLTRSLINPNFVDAQVSAKRRLRGEQNDEDDELQNESIFSRASKLMLQKQAEEEEEQRQARHQATTSSPPKLPQSAPKHASKPDKRVAVVKEEVAPPPTLIEEDVSDNHRLSPSPTESFHSVQAPIKESRAQHMPSRHANRPGAAATSASATRHVAPAFPHTPKKTTKASLPKYERQSSYDRTTASKQYRRSSTRPEEDEDVEEIDTADLPRVHGGGNSRYENALFDDLRVAAHDLFRQPTHPSMRFDIDETDYTDGDEEDSELDSSEYLGSGSYDGEDYDYGEEDGEYDSQAQEEEDEQDSYSDQQEDFEGTPHQSSLPGMKETANIETHPKWLTRLFTDCEEQVSLVEVLGKMRRFMNEFKDAFTAEEHQGIKDLCISENEIALEMASEYEQELADFKKRCRLLNAMARMIDIRHSFYEEFKTTFSRHEELTQSFDSFDAELAESFHKAKQSRHYKDRPAAHQDGQPQSKPKRRHRHEQPSESDDRQEEEAAASQPHLPTEAEYFAQKKYEEAQRQLAEAAQNARRPSSVGGKSDHRSKKHSSHYTDEPHTHKHASVHTKSSHHHRASRR